ncbi:MAG: hypothetical protein U9R19_10995 [Bacteroidota bacterium]|nr:hypothetical protein [Bacteroidota bacterium]
MNLHEILYLKPKIKKSKLFLLIMLTAMFAQYSCSEITEYSEIPEIKYLDHIALDSVDILDNPIRFVDLRFSIIDGDGDFGLKESDTLPPFDTIYNNNFFSVLYGYKNGGFELVEGIVNPDSRIKFIAIENHKAYKADIYIEFEYSKNLVNYDTLKYDFYVVDRALNHSNTVTSPNIIFNK